MVALALLLGACSSAPPPERAPGDWSSDELRQLSQLQHQATPPPSPTNRVAEDPAAQALGRALFYDGGLSSLGLSCAHCHDPDKHFTDGLVLGEGAGTTARHTPTIEGSQWGNWFFWDGRADSLWMQATGPVEHPHEMAGDRTSVAHRVAAEHRAPYEAIFGVLPSLDGLPAHARPTPDAPESAENQAWEGLSSEQQLAVNTVFVNSMKAVAAFERTLVPGPGRFDAYAAAVVSGDAAGGGHLTAQEIEGLSFFLRDGACVSCHHGPMFTDRSFHVLGLLEPSGYDQGRTLGAAQVLKHPLNCGGDFSDAEDCPELRYLDSTFPDFQAAFKTPTLRNVVHTAPYMHNGTLADLDAVLDFYSTLPATPMANHRELTLQPLTLTTEDRAALVAFLHTLDGGPVPASQRAPVPTKVP